MKFNEKFATDDLHTSMALTADGCMNRLVDHTPFRELELNTKIDSFGNSAEVNDRTTMNYVMILAKHGKQPNANETIEQFIVKNMSILMQEEI